MRIIESDNDGFEFERAYMGERAGAPLPIAVMGGVECCIETEPAPLAYGLAFCQPLDPRRADDWPISVVVDRGYGLERLWNMTADPKVVEAARRLMQSV